MVQLLARLNNFLELTGWVFLILLLPFSYESGPLSWHSPALFIPASCAMALRHGRLGLRVASIAGVVNLFPGIILGMFEFSSAVWIYVTGCFAGWVICRGADWPAVFPSGFTAKQFLAAALMPLAFSFGLGIFDFDLRLYQLIFVAVAALAIGGASALAVLGCVAIFVLIGLFLDRIGFDGDLDRLWGDDAEPTNALLAEIINWGSLHYDFDAASDLTTAAVVFFIARYMASFAREAHRSLPGRAFPPLWIRIFIIVTLLFLTQSNALSWALYNAYPHTNLSLPPYGPAFYATVILAGFLLPRANFAVSAITLLYIQLSAENFQDINLDLGDFAYAWGFGSVGVFWSHHIKGKGDPIIPPGWSKFGVFYGTILIGNLAQYEKFGLGLIPLLWFGGLLLLWWVLRRRYGTRYIVEGWQIEVVNVLSAAVLLFLFWGQIETLSEQIRTMFLGATSLFALNLFLVVAWFVTLLFVGFFSIGMSFVVLLASAETLREELTRILGRDRAVLRSQSTPQRVAIALRDRFIGDTGRVISLRAFGLSMLTTLPPLIIGVFFGAGFFEAGVPDFGIVEQSFQSSGGDSDTWEPLVVPPDFQDVPLTDVPPVDDIAPMVLDEPVILMPETDN